MSNTPVNAFAKICGFATLIVFALIIALGASCISGVWNTATKYYSPDKAAENYLWFKQTGKDIEARKVNLDTMIAQYNKASKRKDLDRADKERLALREAEIIGVLSSYNNLVASYNTKAESVLHQWANFEEQLPKRYEKFTWNP